MNIKVSNSEILAIWTCEYLRVYHFLRNRLMHITSILLFLILSIHVDAQDLKCYCFSRPAPTLFNLQTDAKEITEWIIIKADSAAVVSFMDKKCEQPYAFFEEKYIEHSRKNRTYKIEQTGDSIQFTKILNFNLHDERMQQKYVFRAKVYRDSLAAHVDYPVTENSPTTINDLTGSPDRIYKKLIVQ